ncbi:uncharacterized protein BDV14DRAFT_196357 [Aspergillus stella-maris]|uniref:uncharacterized protein n=1 Tax=Aspergillus stella-maris TaxID=1810926 RepID=UPI003CCE2283
MEPFQLTLPNDGVVAGRHSIPPLSNLSPKYRPLIVALHGGTYDSRYFDAHPKYSASLPSAAYGIPFISIDRPSYGGTSSILPVPEGSDFFQKTGTWLHRYILPALWTEFGQPNQCTAIVILAHSLGVIGGVIAAALHAEDDKQLYPLAGFIASGMGNTQAVSARSAPLPHITIDDEHMLLPPEIKDAIMFKPHTTVPDILNLCAHLNAISPTAEIARFADLWMPVWKEWAARVSVPVMFALVVGDPFFITNEDELEICVQAFRNSGRADGSLVPGAPHCMELSYWAQGWYARCFGFAMECSASLGSAA